MEGESKKALGVTKQNKGEDDRGVLHLEAQLVRDRSHFPWDLFSISDATGLSRGLISGGF